MKRWTGPSDSEWSNPATYLYYNGWNLVQEGPSAGNAEWIYFHGGRVDEMLAAHHLWSNGWNYYHYDARGHTIGLTDWWGNLVEQYDYHAFGSVFTYDGAGNWVGAGATQRGNRFLFTGREWLKDLGIYDYRHRMYHPELGRFLQPDPLHFGAGDYNLYRYCHNDPVNHSDPTGLTIIPSKDLRDDWKRAKPELMKDAEMRKIINRLERKDVKVELLRTKDPVSRATFDKGFRIFWNPNSAIKSKADGTRLSPAVALGHEMDHTHEALTNPSAYIRNYNTTDSQYTRAEERRVITRGAEASMMRTFYKENPRSDYDIIPYHVDDPLSR